MADRYIYRDQSNLKFDPGTEFDNILGYESGAQVGSIDEKKTTDKKSRAAIPLKG
jgi:hypothetical protein